MRSASDTTGAARLASARTSSGSCGFSSARASGERPPSAPRFVLLHDEHADQIFVPFITKTSQEWPLRFTWRSASKGKPAGQSMRKGGHACMEPP